MTFAQECSAMMEEIGDSLGASVTYRRRTQSSFTGSTGKFTPTATSDTTVRAVRGPSVRRMLDGLQTPAETIEWLIPAADLANDPAAGDLIIVGSGPGAETHNVIGNPELQAARAAWKVMTRI